MTEPSHHAPTVRHRLLLQVFDVPSESKAREEIARIFGPEKAAAAVFVKGVYRTDRRHYSNSGIPWIWKPNGGFMAFIEDRS